MFAFALQRSRSRARIRRCSSENKHWCINPKGCSLKGKLPFYRLLLRCPGWKLRSLRKVKNAKCLQFLSIPCHVCSFFCHATLMLCPIWRYYVDETTAFVKNLAFLGCVLGGDVTYKCISNICLRSTFQRPLFTRQWSACMQGHEPPSPSHQCRLSHTYLPVKSFIPLITGQWLYQQLHQVFFYMLFTQIIWIIV